MGFCEEQKGLKSDENLNSHIPGEWWYESYNKFLTIWVPDQMT